MPAVPAVPARPFRSVPRRRGAIAPMTAVMSAFILGMVAFAVDTSWIVLAQSELQNAADAAALAASNELMDGYVLYHGPNQDSAEKTKIVAATTKTATATAKEYAGYNGAGGVHKLALLDADVEYGVVDSAGAYKALASAGGFPNTVKVTLRRDSSANTPLGLFFAPVIGTKNISLRATASATIYVGKIDGFDSSTGLPVGMLPMTYDVNAWKAFLKTGKDPDGSLRTDKDGNPILRVYPSVKDTGNFGQLTLDDAHAGASEVRDWIRNGMSPADVKALQSTDLIPLSKRTKDAWDWLGNTGFKSTNVMDVNDRTGISFLLPLFKPAESNGNNYEAGVGNGSHYNYNIVEFVSVQIVSPRGENREVVVRPAAYIDPSAVFEPGTVVPAGSTTSSYTLTTFAAPRLTN